MLSCSRVYNIDACWKILLIKNYKTNGYSLLFNIYFKLCKGLKMKG